MPTRIYQWEQWLTKSRTKLIRGQDYICSSVSMAQQIRNAASYRGVKVKIQEVADGLLIRLVKEEMKEKEGEKEEVQT